MAARRGTRPPLKEPPPTPPWWRTAVDAVCVLAVAGAVAPWLLSGAINELAGAERYTVLGRLAGLLSAALVLLQLFFMARIPFVERAVGHLELVGWHRRLGIWSIGLLLLHVVLIGIGYAGSPAAAVTTLVNLVMTTKTMPMATAGTVALVLVFVTSVPPVREYLSYEWWHLIHLYAYLGAGIAVPHEIVLGGSLADHPLWRGLWLAAWVATLTSVLVWRLLIPFGLMSRHEFRVHRVVQEVPQVWSVYVRGRRISELGVRAGQFFVVRFVTGSSISEGHPYSISSAPRNDELRFTIKELGDGSSRVRELRPGTKVLLEGPFGRLTGEVRTRRKVVFMVAGIGVTPIRALIESLRLRPGEATVLYRSSTAEEVIFREEMIELCARTRADLWFLVGPRDHARVSFLPSGLGRRLDSEVLRELVPDIAGRDVYMCGSDAWMTSAMSACIEAGVVPARIHLESFTG